MSDERDSYRRILASTSIIGGAAAISILIGLVRSKLFALALGPAGIGLIGILTSIVNLGSQLVGMGLGFSGVRQIAASVENRDSARRALWIATGPLAVLGALAIWFAREEISYWVVGNHEYALEIGISGIGVALAIIGASQLAELQGLRRIGDLARVRILGVLLATFIGVPAVVFWPRWGIVAAVIAVPLASVLAALPFRPRAAARDKALKAKVIGEQIRSLLSLGAVVMMTGTLMALALVVVRAIIVREGGIETAGLFQAVFAISAANVALVLAAMSADYFPQLAGIEGDRAAADRLVDRQLRTALLLGAPLLVGMAAASPLILRILYTGAFEPAQELLRWQIAGDLLKLPGWALGFVLVARRDTARYLLVELTFVVAYVGGSLLLFPLLGLRGAGVAYFAAYAFYSLCLVAICRKRHGVHLSRDNVGLIAVALLLIMGIILLYRDFPLIAALSGFAAAGGIAVYGLREIDRLALNGGFRTRMLGLMARVRKS